MKQYCLRELGRAPCQGDGKEEEAISFFFVLFFVHFFCSKNWGVVESCNVAIAGDPYDFIHAAGLTGVAQLYLFYYVNLHSFFKLNDVI